MCIADGMGRCGEQKTTCGSRFSPFTMWAPNYSVKLGASIFTYRSLLLALFLFLLKWFGVGWPRTHYVPEDDLDFPASISYGLALHT